MEGCRISYAYEHLGLASHSKLGKLSLLHSCERCEMHMECEREEEVRRSHELDTTQAAFAKERALAMA